jgi:hypothetical protein
MKLLSILPPFPSPSLLSKQCKGPGMEMELSKSRNKFSRYVTEKFTNVDSSTGYFSWKEPKSTLLTGHINKDIYVLQTFIG